ncbi:MAG: hypothetical protein Q9190_001782 [Brigantiaea leucoxantha]
MARSHYIVRVGNEGLAPRTSDRAPNHWHYLSAQHLWGFPRGMTHVKVRAQFEADVDNPQVTTYIWFLCNGYGGPGHFVQVGIGRRHLGHGPARNGPLPLPEDMTVRLQLGFDHWFEWDPVNDSAAFQERVHNLEAPRPTFIPTLRHVTGDHPSLPLFEDLVGNAAVLRQQAPPVARPPLPPPLPSDPPVELDLRNILHERTDPHGQGFVYLIRMSFTPFLKIGMSLDPEIRIRTLQTGNPYPLQLVKTWAVRDMRSAELSLHRRFEGKRVDNESVKEWFDFGGGGGERVAAEVKEEKVVGQIERTIAELE